MPKPTKGAAAIAGTKPNAAQETTSSTTPAGGIDLNKLTPEQLAALQKQLKATKKVSKDDHKKRFEIIDGMLKTKVTEDNIKDGEKVGEFKYTTRDIINALDSDGLIKDKIAEDWDQVEIKKVQARKQFLEKKRDEKGNLVFPEGTFGYKASAGAGFALTPVRVAAWFDTAENVAKLTPEQRATILKTLGAK